ncbi:6-carboxytetrahydropterin synthase QueD [Waddlia chondrophila]|uniref:6-carboxytetrahydropterin synthase QueD n=1 Tax=Waddlia chondrophila TaxID=71667 RepID=UPI000309862D|nr:6-carboxytetrahydropterin synthase QueD [Waddlia chondrophila]
MFTIIKTFRFEAGHQLAHHDGACKHPHGHSYVLEIQVKSGTLIDDGPKKNMVIDFHHISDIVKPMINTYFDHKWLNDTLETDSPTSEFIARWIYRHLDRQIPGLHAIGLSETATSKVIYTETDS